MTIIPKQITNADRAELARRLIDQRSWCLDRTALPDLHPEDQKNALADLLADLQHFADAEGMDFDDLLSQSRFHFRHESQWALTRSFHDRPASEDGAWG